MAINDPSLFAGESTIGMHFLMALKTQGSKELIAAEPLAYAPRLVMDVITLFVFATLTLWVEGKIRLLLLGILVVFILTFWGCSPQPARSF